MTGVDEKTVEVYRQRALTCAALRTMKASVVQLSKQLAVASAAMKRIKDGHVWLPKEALDELIRTDPVRAIGEPLVEHLGACEDAEVAIVAAANRLVEARAHLAIAAAALRLPPDIQVRVDEAAS